MPSLIEKVEGADFEPRSHITELRIGDEPVLIGLFTDDFEGVKLHYVDDDSVKSYVVCPGDSCPMCHLSYQAKDFYLLPAYDHDEREVKVMRISPSRGVASLLSVLMPFLRDTEIADKLVILRRQGYRYFGERRPIGGSADRGIDAIKRFVEARAGGLSLASAFAQMTVEDLRDVPKIRTKLELTGGLPAPNEKPRSTPGAGPDPKRVPDPEPAPDGGCDSGAPLAF